METVEVKPKDIIIYDTICIQNDPDTNQVTVKFEPEICDIKEEPNFVFLHTEESDDRIKVEESSGTHKTKTEIPDIDCKEQFDPLDDIKEQYEFNEEYDIKEDEKSCVFQENDASHIDDPESCEESASKQKNKHSSTKNQNKTVVDENKKRFSCSKCHYKTNNVCHIKTHSFIHDKINAEWFYCNICNYKTIYKCNLGKHEQIHTKNSKLICKFCNKSLNRKSALDLHLLNIHNISDTITSKIHQCKKCSYQTVNVFGIKKHMLSHKDIRTELPILSCDQCNYTTHVAFHLKRHLLTHTNNKPFSCITCNKVFNQKMQYDSHIVLHHPDNKDLMGTVSHKIHECQHCNYKCINTSNFKLHMKNKHS